MDAVTESGHVAQPDTRWNTRMVGWVFGQATSLVGDQIYLVALAWGAVLAAGPAGPAGAGLVLTCAAVPRAALILSGGVIVDRVGARPIILASDLLRAIVMVGTALAVASAHTQGVWLLAGVAAVFGTVDALFYPASGSLPPRLFASERLAKLQGILSLARYGSVIIGAPVGGYLVAESGLAIAFAANAVTFVVSFITLASVKERVALPGSEKRRPFFAELCQGMSYVAQTPWLRTLMIAVTVMEFGFVGPFVVGVPLAARINEWGPFGVGTISGAFGVGAAVSALVLSILGRIPRAGLATMMLALAHGICIALVGLTDSLTAAAVSVAVSGLCAGMAGALVVALIQTHSDPSRLGRVMSLVSFMSFGLAPLSMPLTALGVDQVGLALPFLAGGALHVVTAIVGLRNPALRSVKLPPRQQSTAT